MLNENLHNLASKTKTKKQNKTKEKQKLRPTNLDREFIELEMRKTCIIIVLLAVGMLI